MDNGSNENPLPLWEHVQEGLVRGRGADGHLIDSEPLNCLQRDGDHSLCSWRSPEGQREVLLG